MVMFCFMFFLASLPEGTESSQIDGIPIQVLLCDSLYLRISYTSLKNLLDMKTGLRHGGNSLLAKFKGWYSEAEVSNVSFHVIPVCSMYPCNSSCICLYPRQTGPFNWQFHASWLSKTASLKDV